MSSGDGRNGTDGAPGQPGADLAQRMQRLGARLDEVARAEEQKARAREPKRPAGGQSALVRAFRLSAEFIAGVAAGGLIGWSFDQFTGASPWGMIVFLMLGFVTGVYNVMRATGQLKLPSAGDDDGAR